MPETPLQLASALVQGEFGVALSAGVPAVIVCTMLFFENKRGSTMERSGVAPHLVRPHMCDALPGETHSGRSCCRAEAHKPGSAGKRKHQKHCA